MNIVFDLGGVVFNWQPLLLLQQVLPQHAVDQASAQHLAGQIFQSFTAGSDWAEFDRGTIAAEPMACRIAERTDLTAGEVMAVVNAIPAHLSAVGDTVALLRGLKDAGHRLFYLSNMPAPYADHLERCHDFCDWFEDGVFSARVQLIKPEPAIFREAARRFAAMPADLLFIDDVAHNVQAARALGWQGLHFQGATGCEATLRARALL
ncbi:MAG: HAD family phosphatase [Burkholderiaceae bacterium]|nr:HAD family phosphatase [Burkholderiaceae bacterium]